MESSLVLVANSGDDSISTFRFSGGDSPTMERLAVSPVGKGCSAFVVDAERDLVYASAKGEDAPIDVFSLDRASGALSQVGSLPQAGPMVYFTLAHDNTLLAGCSYHGGFALVAPVDREGGIGEPTGRVDWPNAHSVVVADGGRHLYLVSLGADLVAQYELSPAGELTPLDPPTVAAPEGSGPRHLVFNDDETRAYLLTEYGGEVLVFDRDQESGALTQRSSQVAHATDRGLKHSRFGADPVEEHLIWGADLHLARDEQYLLASERCESTLASLPVEDDGDLAEISSLIEVEKQPRGFAVSPDGRWAVVAGEKSTMVSLVSIGEDGRLRPVSRHETGAGANWVRFVS